MHRSRPQGALTLMEQYGELCNIFDLLSVYSRTTPGLPRDLEALSGHDLE